MREAVGIRELRQNLSKYLGRVAQGESLEVTDHGRGVAMLVPLPERSSALERLIAEGRVIPARGNLDDLPEPLELEGDAGISISEALQEQREERFP